MSYEKTNNHDNQKSNLTGLLKKTYVNQILVEATVLNRQAPDQVDQCMSVCLDSAICNVQVASVLQDHPWFTAYKRDQNRGLCKIGKYANLTDIYVDPKLSWNDNQIVMFSGDPIDYEILSIGKTGFDDDKTDYRIVIGYNYPDIDVAAYDVKDLNA